MKISEALSILEAIRDKSTGIVQDMAQNYINDLSKYDSNIKIGTAVKLFIEWFE